MKKTLKALMLASLMMLVLILSSCDLLGSLIGGTDEVYPDPVNQIEENIAMGNPSWIIEDNLTIDDHFMIERDCFVSSYNNKTHNPNWVSWHLAGEDMGNLKRPSGFYSDPMLPKDWDKVHEEDYQYSKYGFSRGHMCPNADRNGDADMQHDTFYMTNMVPQVQVNNGGPWQDLEEYLQNTVKSGKEAYIISGPYGVGGIGYNDHREVQTDFIQVKDRKREFQITVPEYVWKVAIVLPEGTTDITRINSGTDVEAIAVWMPNSHATVSVKDPWEKYQVSIDFVEEMTGYDFYSHLNDKVEERIESRNSNLDPK